MRNLIRFLLVGLFSIGVAAGAVTILLNPEMSPWRRIDRRRQPDRGEGGGTSGPAREGVQSAPGAGQPAVFDIIPDKFEDGGYETAVRSCGADHATPARSRSCASRSGGVAAAGSPRLKTNYEHLSHDSPPTRNELLEKVSLQQSIGFLYMYEGRFLEAASWLESALETGRRRTARRRSDLG